LGWAELRAIRSNKWKYVRAPRSELYDLETDPAESENVISRYPVVAKKLENRLREVISFGVPGTPEQIQLTAVDAETIERLRSLGYVSVRSTATIGLTGEGVDPKDRVKVLQLIEQATTTTAQVSIEERIGFLEQALQEDPESSLLSHALGEVKGSQLVDQGEAALEQNDANKACELFKQALEHDPDSWAGHGYLAEIYLAQGSPHKAYEHLVWIEETTPDSAIGQFLMARYWYERRDYQRARTYAERVREVRPSNSRLRNLLGNIYLALDLIPEAVQEYTAAIELGPDRPEYKLNLKTARKRLEQAKRKIVD
jgi:tetratricopeptide (TPR) repeat protein